MWRGLETGERQALANSVHYKLIFPPFLIRLYYVVFYSLDYKVFIHGAATTPIPLLEAMSAHGLKSGLKNVELLHIHTEGPATYNKPEFEGLHFFYIYVFTCIL
jgi:hypothetical protein